MKEFVSLIHNTEVKPSEAALFFLGQAGFIIKTEGGKLIAIDPYLSDCCNRFFGFKRLMPNILRADEICFDAIVATHAHYDHFDPDSIPELMLNGKTEFIGALDTEEECRKLGISERTSFIAEGDTVDIPGGTLTAVFCDHGKDTPHAIGLLIEISGKRIYVMGDTALRTDKLTDERLHGADVLIMPINGAFGNLNEKEAAIAADILKPKLAIPSHYWNFAEHHGDPGKFKDMMAQICPEQKYLLMRQGELTVIS